MSLPGFWKMSNPWVTVNGQNMSEKDQTKKVSADTESGFLLTWHFFSIDVIPLVEPCLYLGCTCSWFDRSALQDFWGKASIKKLKNKLAAMSTGICFLAVTKSFYDAFPKQVLRVGVALAPFQHFLVPVVEELLEIGLVVLARDLKKKITCISYQTSCFSAYICRVIFHVKKRFNLFLSSFFVNSL